MYFRNLLACKEFLLFLKQVILFGIEINEAVQNDLPLLYRIRDCRLSKSHCKLCIVFPLKLNAILPNDNQWIVSRPHVSTVGSVFMNIIIHIKLNNITKVFWHFNGITTKMSNQFKWVRLTFPFGLLQKFSILKVISCH